MRRRVHRPSPSYFCALRGIGTHEWRRQLDGSVSCAYCRRTIAEHFAEIISDAP